MTKDLFSSQAEAYARYRPSYPKELFAYILSFVKEKKIAWDCATGNGQAAVVLANDFQQVEATDISEAQLANAVQKENVRYKVSPAEHTPFPNNNFDLITVATAYHWLNWAAFYVEATRVAKPGAVVAVWAYNIVQCNDAGINAAVHRFYFDVIFSYWDKERRHVENAYRTVDFNFAPLPEKEFFIDCVWTRNDLLGYVSTWSSVQHYQQQQGESPLPILEKELQTAWAENEPKNFRFPLFLKIGRVTK